MVRVGIQTLLRLYRKTTMKNKEIIRKWLRNELSDEEKQILIDSGDWTELQRMSDALMAYRSPEYQVEQQLDALLAKKKSPRQIWMLPVFRVAAAVLLLVSVYAIFMNSRSVEYQTMPGEAISFFLPDSTRVDMNALSEISFNKQQWDSKRNVILNGEAFFDVIPGSVFDVQTSNGIIRVVGTEFNIRSWQNYFEVTCFEGKVSVITDNNTELLTPGKRIRIYNGQQHVDEIEIDQQADLTKRYQESHFASVPLYVVFDELERQFDVDVQLSGINDDVVFTGAFTHENLAVALRSICLPLGLEFEISDDHVIIK